MILEPNGAPSSSTTGVYNGALKGAHGSYIEWSAVIGGTMMASAISLVLVQFGGAIGLAATSPFDTTRELTPGGLLAIGLWMLWVQVTASMTGGYIAGRMRAPISTFADHEREVRDGVHGALVWATGTVVVALVVALVTSLAAMAANHTGQTANTTTAMTEAQRHTAIIFAFGAAAISFVSGVAAWWAATMGGEHRDSGVDHSHHFSFKKR